MGTPLTFDLFDRFGHFVMPTPEQVASLDAETQERFRAVQSAAAVSEAATDMRKAAEQHVIVALGERDAAEVDLRRKRPTITATQAAKDWIRSQRAE